MISYAESPPAIVVRVPAREIDFDALCWAIEEKENGQWFLAGGRPCWGRAAWKEVAGKVPYSMASKPSLSRYFMKARLAQLALRFEREGITGSVWRVSTAWNLGYDGAKRAVRKHDDYGDRCQNLYEKRMGR